MGARAELKLVGAVAAFVVLGTHAAAHSELARHISPGESPSFAWVRSHVDAGVAVSLAYLLALAALDLGAIRRGVAARSSLVLLATELVALGLLAAAVVGWRPEWLAPGHLLLQASLLGQVAIGAGAGSARGDAGYLLDLPEPRAGVFLAFAFLLSTIPAALDPPSRRLHEFVELDSAVEAMLTVVVPPLLSGVTGLWLALGVLAILAGAAALRRRAPRSAAGLPLLVLPALAALVFVESLAHAIAWELHVLDLDGARLPLVLVAATVVGALSSAMATRLAPNAPPGRARSRIGMTMLALGAVTVLPVSWALAGRGRRAVWRLLLAVAVVSQLLLGATILFGGLFHPWFTVFSYLKAVLLGGAAVVAAGILVLIVDELAPAGCSRPAVTRRGAMVAAVALVSVAPFVFLAYHPEVKAAVLQYNELSMVQATWARAVVTVLGASARVRLGQTPAMDPARPDPWPPPWTLRRVGPSLLPRDFNLIVVVVDALRGDALGSAGYHRDLTPFLDRWAGEEAIAFRRAYSQGGGTFAAFPFLVAGRSRLGLYHRALHSENLYFALAQAEGIRHVMVVRDFGPRAIFPPDFPVIELAGPSSGGPGRSVPADDVFGWTQAAIDALGPGERFIAFVHLIDVHNELWKKADGLDLGDSPRDLYDNNVSYVDRAFARFVAWLRRQGLYERTVILFTADHGEQFWEHGASLHGHTLYEEEIRVPLMLLAHRRSGVQDVPVVVADMVPTILELAGYRADPPHDEPGMGISLVPLLRGHDRERYLRRDVIGRASRPTPLTRAGAGPTFVGTLSRPSAPWTNRPAPDKRPPSPR